MSLQELCKSPGKAPLWSWKAYQDRLPREQELHLWWSRNPRCNVGVCMGPVSGLVGIDIDDQAGIDLLADICNGIPDTFNFSTPGGSQRRRLFFRHPDQPIPTKSLRVNGIEVLRIQGKGAQTVMPPSIHPCGVAYGLEWEDRPLVPFPKALLDFLTQEPVKDDPPPKGLAALVAGGASPIVRARAYLAKCDPCISGQGGSAQSFKIACKLIHGFGLDVDLAYVLLMEPGGYNDRCVPPWSEKEWKHHLGNAATKGHAVSFINGTTIDVAKKKPALKPPDPVHPLAVTRTMNAVQKRPVEWLVPDWIPCGKLTVLDGDPGLGKSTLLLDIAARVTTHGVSFTGKQGLTGNVVLISAEDSAEDTIRPRLEAAGANLNRVIELKHVLVAGKERPVELPADIELIESVVAEYQAKLLIIEPLAAFLAGPDANKDQEIRRVLYRLSKIAERQACASVTMRHLNKTSGGKAIYRGNMSIGVIGHARVGLLVGEDPDDEVYRILAMPKINCGPKQPSLRFLLEPVPELNVCKISWQGASSYNADELVGTHASEEQKEQAADKATKVEQAKAILEWLLQQSPGKLVIKEAKAELGKAALSGSSIDRAVKQLGLTVQYTVNEKGERTYFWV